MSGQDSSSTSQSRSNRHSVPEDAKMEHRNSNRRGAKMNQDDVINAGFDPETRSKIASIAKKSPPKLQDENDGGKEHPLLYLHQSVTGNKQRGVVGGGAPNEEEPKQRCQNQQPLKEPNVHEKDRSQSDPNISNVGSKPSKEIAPPDQPKKLAPEAKQDLQKEVPCKSGGRTALLATKAVATMTLLVLWLVLMQKIIDHSSVEGTNGVADILLGISSVASAAQLRILSLVHEYSQYIPALFDTTTKSTVPLEQLEKRLELGVSLLRKYDDASGSAAACEGALHGILDSRGFVGDENRRDYMSLVSTSTAAFSVDEIQLLSKSLLCLGEARLALFSSSFGSQSIKKGQLMMAKESFEAATAVDPTVPSVRGGLGLAYLLLGVMKDDGDNSIQYLFQSIQHLKASLGLANESEHDQADHSISARNAVMHNLGLAHIALDGESSVEGGTTYFQDWMASFRSSSLFESSVISANEGAMLLQMGLIEDAITSLESTASEACGNTPSSRREEETCSIVQQNLALARSANSEGPGSSFRSRSEDVARWNAGISSMVPLKTESSEEHADDVDGADRDVITSNGLEEVADESSGGDAMIKSEAASSSYAESTPEEEEEEEEVIDLVSTAQKTVKPEMQNALAALEKVTAEGPQRTRLLLALARARSSAGDLTGAVDAALKAIGAAASDDEAETSTAYLEQLMERMAGDGEENSVQVIPDEHHAFEPRQKTSSFVESKDLSLLELEMKLELERLKYKVLEQEMMLGRRQPSPQYADDLRAIDYVAEANLQRADHPPKRHATEEAEIDTSDAVEEGKTVDAAEEEPALVEKVITEQVEEKNVIVADEEREEEEAKNATQQLIPEPESESVAATSGDEGNEVQPPAVNGTDVDNSSEEELQKDEPIQLPDLFSPPLKQPSPMPPTAKSYMKMADAYLDKGQYALASKQFLKVIKKAPDHLPAHLGYATALERAGKSKQIETAAMAYGNATKVAIIQGDIVDPLAKVGAGGIAENILRRAVTLAKSSASSTRLETLRALSAHAHTASLAADIYFEIGSEIAKHGVDQEGGIENAMRAFTIANAFIAMRNDDADRFHMKSVVEMMKIALENENDANRVVGLFGEVKNEHMEDDVHVELLVLVGRAHTYLGELETAVTEFTRALSFPQVSSTPSAHHELAIALKKSNGDAHEINLHFEKALDMGLDPSPEAIEALGERNMSVMRALNRQYYKSFSNAGAVGGGGGIMSGGGVGSQSASVFAPKAASEQAASQSETLTILEQGAAAYDGHTPMGGEVEGTESSLSQLKQNRQQGSESNLSNLRR